MPGQSARAYGVEIGATGLVIWTIQTVLLVRAQKMDHQYSRAVLRVLTVLGGEELYAKAKEHGAPYELIRMVAKEGKLPVPNFSAGGIATPADASLVMQLGAEAVFVGSGIFMQDSTTFADPAEAEKRARAIVKAATHYQDPKVLLEVSEDLVGAMKGLAISGLDEGQMLQTRGW